MKQWIASHALEILLAAAALITFDWLHINRKQLNLRWYAALALAIVHVIIGVGSVKLFALAEAGFNAEKAGNMSLFGSIFILPLFYFTGAKLFKRKVSTVFDVFTVPLAITLFLARINCFFGGCCLGKLIPGTEFRFPTREAELVFYAVFVIAMVPRVFKGRGKGRVFPIFMIAYGAFRGVIEFFRESTAYPVVFHLAHVWALTALILGIIILLIQRKKDRDSQIRHRTALGNDRRNSKC